MSTGARRREAMSQTGAIIWSRLRRRLRANSDTATPVACSDELATVPVSLVTARDNDFFFDNTARKWLVGDEAVTLKSDSACVLAGSPPACGTVLPTDGDAVRGECRHASLLRLRSGTERRDDDGNYFYGID
jgi:hypothetical protein